MAYVFLTPEWIDGVRAIRDDYADLDPPEGTPSFRANLVVTDVPFGGGQVLAHADTSSGVTEIELGHVDEAHLRVTLSYDLARTMVVDQKPEAVAMAWIMGKIRVDGDLTKLLPTTDPSELVAAAREAASDPTTSEIGHRIRALTA